MSEALAEAVVNWRGLWDRLEDLGDVGELPAWEVNQAAGEALGGAPWLRWGAELQAWADLVQAETGGSLGNAAKAEVLRVALETSAETAPTVGVLCGMIKGNATTPGRAAECLEECLTRRGVARDVAWRAACRVLDVRSG